METSTEPLRTPRAAVPTTSAHLRRRWLAVAAMCTMATLTLLFLYAGIA